ncbi:FMN-dependent NADH-azoreductase [Pukyongiella litopenaei]|uniref:FMN dependent NADH:quinone oxidoreductase n=1 Tax=Pukyongiella litopenaei TaxID=2605946 RepID=A0A2S0MLT2_9RHOB|nr:NAD(P)H-dependent oxidoreductase [Pukyongiella litopenaei]AVO36836.1 FMN-dependent NADH-azoreductase [Pukyongiella litopenaei]
MTKTLLHIDASVRRDGSATRGLTARIVERLDAARVLYRDLGAAPLPLIDDAWVSANFTPADARSEAQRATLALSDDLVAELAAADTIVIGLPVYNFSVPAGLKAWIDLIARAGVTFQYTENGPRGLLTGKRVIVAMASGGTTEGSDADFAARYLRFMLGFVGMDSVEFVAADSLATDADASLRSAQEAVERLAA